jgi:hypothetical protein
MSKTEAAERPSTPSFLSRATRIALFVNAVAHGSAVIGMITGLAPHAADQPNMARRAAAAGIAGIVMLSYVGKNVLKQPSLIVLALVFVSCNFFDTLYEFLTSRDPGQLAPAPIEGTFLLIYSLFALDWLRSRNT